VRLPGNGAVFFPHPAAARSCAAFLLARRLHSFTAVTSPRGFAKKIFALFDLIKRLFNI
jgi:hypothetical protein